MVLLFLPLCLGLPQNYPWAREGEARPAHYQAHYLNTPFFLIRAGIYFAVWLAVAFRLNRLSAEEDRTGDPALARRAQLFSGPGLILYGLTVTFAGIDWVMSLEPRWYSSIFGALLVTAQMLPALAFGIAALTFLATRREVAAFATPAVWNDLGNLLLAFVMLWTYMSFSQFLLIWSGNLPEEIVWYVKRSEGGWQFLAVVLAVGYFALPFLLLLSRDIKRHPARLRVVAIALGVMSLVHFFWLVAPAFSPQQFYLHPLDIAALVGVAGLWLAYFLRLVQARPLLPVHAPGLKEELGHA